MLLRYLHRQIFNIFFWAQNLSAVSLGHVICISIFFYQTIAFKKKSALKLLDLLEVQREILTSISMERDRGGQRKRNLTLVFTGLPFPSASQRFPEQRWLTVPWTARLLSSIFLPNSNETGRYFLFFFWVLLKVIFFRRLFSIFYWLFV